MRIAWLVVALLLSETAGAEVKIKKMAWVKAPPARPTLEVEVVTGMTGLRADSFSVSFEQESLPVTIKASKVVPFRESTQPMSVVVLVQGSARFLVGEAEPAPQPGYHDVVKTAIDIFARIRPRNTRMALYAYGETVVEKVPLGPAENVTGDALGPPEDYAQVHKKALQRALEQALLVLGNEPGRRVVFLVGDGGNVVDAHSVRSDVERLTAASIEVYVLGASPTQPSATETRRLELLGALGAYRFASQREQVPKVAEFLANEVNNRYTVSFPGLQTSDGSLMPFDGGQHELTVKAGSETSAPETLHLEMGECMLGYTIRCICPGKPPILGPPCEDHDPWWKQWWVWVLAGLALLAAGVLMVALRRERAEEDREAVPEPIPAPPPPPAAPPPDRATRIIELAEDDGSIPVVGWIVPVNGPAAYQTFRLGRRTVIGAGQGCDVRIDDAWMSGRHAEIVLAAGGWVLMDSGSQNGVLFGDRRVERHPLMR